MATGITNGRQEVIVGQIHGPGGTPPIIICVNHKRGGALELFKQGPRQGDLLTGLKPDTKFTYRIESPGNGRLKVYRLPRRRAQAPHHAAVRLPVLGLHRDLRPLLQGGGLQQDRGAMRAPQAPPSSASSAATWSDPWLSIKVWASRTRSGSLTSGDRQSSMVRHDHQCWQQNSPADPLTTCSAHEDRHP